MTLVKSLQNKHLILASGSPRRKVLMEELGLDFEIRIKEIKETYPHNLEHKEISEFLAVLKATPFKGTLKPQDILITADTIVWSNKKALGKPKTRDEGIDMLKSLSGISHEVITSVALTTQSKQVVLSDITQVTFKSLTLEEITYYMDNFKPYDKAGAYGIQEWIGYIGIEKINGNYFNVVGFPVQKFYEALLKL